MDVFHVTSFVPRIDVKSMGFSFYNTIPNFKGGYLDFSHLPELKNIYITEIYMKKENKSSIIKNHKITIKKNLMVFP